MIIQNKRRGVNLSFIVTALIIIACLSISYVRAEPIGPTITVESNSTKNATSGVKVNSTINGTITPGGYLFTMDLVSLQQNKRWKAYVGNVTGTLTLDDANDNTIFQWSLSTVTGEVYATRGSSINWSGINCTWIADSKTTSTEGLSSNRTPEHDENIFLSHTNKDDNITATFQYMNHSSIQVGGVTIGKDQCYSLQTWQEDSEQSFTDSDDANFTEVILYDASIGTIGGNVIYATELEQDLTGYRSDSTYDFQIILPEDGTSGFSSSTAYYFYVELT